MLGPWSCLVVCCHFDTTYVIIKYFAYDFWSRFMNCKPHDFKSFIRCIIAITSSSVDDKAIYSASIELSVIRDCILLFHIIGQPA